MGKRKEELNDQLRAATEPEILSPESTDDLVLRMFREQAARMKGNPIEAGKFLGIPEEKTLAMLAERAERESQRAARRAARGAGKHSPTGGRLERILPLAHITDKTIKKMETPKTGSLIQWDSEIKRFGMRINAAGAASFILEYRFNGTQRRYTIGRYPEYTATAARDEAVELKKKIRNGIDPLEERHRANSEPTLDGLAKDY